MTNPEGEIRQSDRLVSKDFQPDLAGELRAALGAREPEPGYPGLESRLRMSDAQIDEWFDSGRDFAALRFNPSSEHPMGINWLVDHSNRVRQIEREGERGIPESQSGVRRDNGIQDFHDVTFRKPLLSGWTRDSRGVPIAPWYKEALQYGAVTGPGFYWDYGENASANAIILGEEDDRLKLAVIEKEADGRIFVPGGMIDPGEDPEEAALREADEEIAFLRGLTSEQKREALRILRPLPVKPLGTRRLTINAGEASASSVFVARDSRITNHPLERGDDATHARWTTLNRDTLGKLFVPHANDVRLAVREYEKQHGVRIAPDGTMHAEAD